MVKVCGVKTLRVLFEFYCSFVQRLIGEQTGLTIDL